MNSENIDNELHFGIYRKPASTEREINWKLPGSGCVYLKRVLRVSSGE